MNTSETSGNEETTHSKEQLMLVVNALRAFARPFNDAAIEVEITDDEIGYYDIWKTGNKFLIKLNRMDNDIRKIYPVLAFAWARVLTWEEAKKEQMEFSNAWGIAVAVCWRIISGRRIGLKEDEFFSEPE